MARSVTWLALVFALLVAFDTQPAVARAWGATAPTLGLRTSEDQARATVRPARAGLDEVLDVRGQPAADVRLAGVGERGGHTQADPQAPCGLPVPPPACDALLTSCRPTRTLGASVHEAVQVAARGPRAPPFGVLDHR